MGYILPITQFNYMDYQKRQIDDEHSPYEIKGPFKVVLEEKTNNDAQFDENEIQRENKIPRINRYLLEELVKSELTGKGGMFSELI